MYNHLVMDVFDAIRDPTRRQMLELLRVRPLAATQLAAAFPISQPAISRHLRSLREADLVRVSGDDSDGRLRTYRLNPAPLDEVEGWLAGFWQGRLDAFAEYVDEAS
jgi:DNA-binding transcriptional ArsR family regulator